jgi:hypothetical protein
VTCTSGFGYDTSSASLKLRSSSGAGFIRLDQADMCKSYDVGHLFGFKLGDIPNTACSLTIIYESFCQDAHLTVILVFSSQTRLQDRPDGTLSKGSQSWLML